MKNVRKNIVIMLIVFSLISTGTVLNPVLTKAKVKMPAKSYTLVKNTASVLYH